MTATQSPTKEGFDEVHENKTHAIWLFKNSHDCFSLMKIEKKDQND